MKSGVFQEDISNIIASPEIPWREFKNCTVFITGATGLIGSALTSALCAASARHNLNLRVIAHGRNTEKTETLSKDYGIETISGDIRESLASVSAIAEGVDFIFHCAAITRSTEMAAKPVDVITTAIGGTRNVLELAREKKVQSVVYLSSMEVYGQTPAKEVMESHLGYLDLLNPRTCYPESKRMCENLYACYFSQYGVPVKIARLAQTFGAGTPKNDTRVFAQFARSAMAKEPIVLHTDGKSRGNYCYLADAVHALLIIALKGENGENYNVANPDAVMSIREMAELVADKYGTSVAVDIPTDTLKLGYAPDTGFALNCDKLKMLGWKSEYGLEDIYERMIADWRESENA